MTKKPTLVLAFLVLTAIAASASGPNSFTLVNGMVEGPDPIPTDWDSVLTATAGETPDFGVAGTEFPADVAYEPAEGLPAVVWEYSTGSDLDIAFAVWTGDDWGRTEFLSSSVYDERDPRLVFDDQGSGFAVWWRQLGGGSVFLARRTPGGVWLPAAAWHGARPEIAVHDGAIHVVFEEPVPRGMKIRYLHVSSDGDVQQKTLVRTRRSGATLVGFHQQEGRLWAYWQHNANQVGWSELIDGRWVAPASLP